MYTDIHRCIFLDLIYHEYLLDSVSLENPNIICGNGQRAALRKEEDNFQFGANARRSYPSRSLPLVPTAQHA